jgi:hypothetical protein
MLTAMAEGTGKCPVLGHCLLQQLANVIVTRYAECPRRGQGIINFQRMMRRMAPEAVRGHLALSMGFMTLRTIGDLAVYLVAESTELLGMSAFKVSKVLTRAFMACKARFFYISGKVQGKRFMGIGVASKTVLQFKM